MVPLEEALSYYASMTYTTQELTSEFADLVLKTHGQHTVFDNVAACNSANDKSLVFAQCLEQVPSQAAVIVSSSAVICELEQTSDAFLVSVDNVRFAQAKIKQRYDDYLRADSEWEAIHSSAVVHNSSIIGKDCRVGPNAVIGANCVLGARVVVRANAVVEHGVRIGCDSVVHACVNIGYNTELGERVSVQAGSTIGSEGFGFAADANKQYHRIPHTGKVVIEDDVHIGANTCIDRATYGVTRIARGVKIDNLVHIAHNVEVDEDTLLTAATVIAGSSKIGKRVIASGQTGVLDHKTVADDAVLVQRCGVSEDIPSAGMWAGTPVKPFKEYVRNLSLGKKVARLEKQLKELQQRFNSSD